jgi:hypothetical protein
MNSGGGGGGLHGSEKQTFHDATYVHIVDLFLQKSYKIHRLTNLHASEPHDGIHGRSNLFLARLSILWHVGYLLSLKLQQN